MLSCSFSALSSIKVQETLIPANQVMIPQISVTQLDHLVLTVKDIPTSINFYQQALGMTPITFSNGRFALAFGNQKINLHQLGNEFEPKAEHVQNGSADLCFITNTPIEEVIFSLKNQNIEILEGPVIRTGATRKLLSVYFRDPDGNLIELSNYL